MREYVPCIMCKGSGVKRFEKLVNYHKGYYDTWYENCIKCDGSGILIKVTTYEKYKKPTVTNAQ